MIVRVRSYPTGPRVWIANQRVHHGATGAVLVGLAFLIRRRKLAALGITLMVHDGHDWKVWFSRDSFALAVLQSQTEQELSV